MWCSFVLVPFSRQSDYYLDGECNQTEIRKMKLGGRVVNPMQRETTTTTSTTPTTAWNTFEFGSVLKLQFAQVALSTN